MMGVATRPWNPAEHFESDEDIVAYMNAALEDGAPGVIVAVLGDIAHARDMAEMARSAGLGRESLYKAKSPSGNPDFATVIKVLDGLGLRLHTEPGGVQAHPPMP